MGLFYTLGIKRRFWFGYRTFKVVSHEPSAPDNRLFLTLANGAQVSLPGLSGMELRVYPDYRQAQHNLDEFRRQQEGTAAAHAEPAVAMPQQTAKPVAAAANVENDAWFQARLQETRERMQAAPIG